jgi:asparagine synthase (glutamine-hydrolysing)
MCGIAGIADVAGGVADEALLRAMTSVQAHRGPDGEAVVCRGPVGLGHRRLAIIDLNTGDQPMANEDGSIWIVFNGEIYNFHELRRELEARGARFRTVSDTEVILKAYEADGPACVERLRGVSSWPATGWASSPSSTPGMGGGSCSARKSRRSSRIRAWVGTSTRKPSATT